MSNTKIVLHNLKNIIKKSKPSLKKEDNSEIKNQEIYDGTMKDVYEIFKKTPYHYENEDYQTLNSDSSDISETNLLAEDELTEYDSDSSFSFSDSSISD